MDNISSSAFADLFRQGVSLIDVRAPVEFAQGSLPGAINLPIMNDDERAQVGTAYKKQGREVAMGLGHQLVSGEIKEKRLRLWADHISKFPETVIYCFRGGLRSQITQHWLSELGIHRPLIKGGYKKARNYLREEIDNISVKSKFLMLSGPTGSAKTRLLQRVQPVYPSIDLEHLARHRGSAFGAGPLPQPTQIDFENSLSVELLKLESQTKKILLEDESRLIGRCAMPEKFFEKMRSSELLYVEESFEQRVENIFEDYILATAIGQRTADSAKQFALYRKSVSMISRKLGGARAQEILNDLETSEIDFFKDSASMDSNRVWIGKLLAYYYDPFYAQSLAQRNPQILARGNSQVILDYLKNIP